MPTETIWLAPSGEGGSTRNWGKCKSCGAPIYWCRTAKNNKAIPFDAVPPVIEDGAFGNQKVDASQVHWSTCPDAEKFRRTAPAAARSRKNVEADGRADDVF